MKYATEDLPGKQILAAAALLPALNDLVALSGLDSGLAAEGMAAINVLVDDYLAQAANTHLRNAVTQEWENGLTVAARELGMSGEDRDVILKRHQVWSNPDTKVCSKCGSYLIPTPDGVWIWGQGEYEPSMESIPWAGCRNQELGDWSNEHDPIALT